MHIYQNLDQLPEMDEAFITIGNFDGLHLGHQKIINTMIHDANGKTTIVITFQKSPIEILYPDKFGGYIFPYGYKIKFIEKTGLEHIFLLDFEKVAMIEALDFINLIRNKIHNPSLFVGFNFRFGKDNKGNIELLQREALLNKFSVKVIDQLSYNEMNQAKIISSSLIRNCISKGEMNTVTAMLGRPYIYSSKVIKGNGIGRHIGFPTINLSKNNQILPQNGVYYTLTFINCSFYPAMTYIGNRPTFPDNQLRIETNIINYNGPLNGDTFAIFFIQRVRKENKFNNLEELQKYLYNDKEMVLNLHKSYKIPPDFYKIWNIIIGGT